VSGTSLIVQRGVTIPMRDGCGLRADVYRAADAGPRPALLQRTPYDRTSSPVVATASIEPLRAVEHGFVVVIQDVRGRFASDGTFDPFLQETEDGVDTLRWIGEQPWSDGRVAMYGRSYVGATQLLAAVGAPAELVAIAPDRSSSEYWEGWTYQGGVLRLGFVLTWVLGSLTRAELERVRVADPALATELARTFDPLADDPVSAFAKAPGELIEKLDDLAPYLRGWLEHRARDKFWSRASAADRLHQISVPALHIAGWYDVFLAGSLETYERLRGSAATPAARDGQRLIIGPWTHQTSGDASGSVLFGRQAAIDTLDATRLHLDFFAACLSGEPPPGPRVLLYVMGANRWRAEEDWPPPRAEPEAWHLRADGTLDTKAPGDEESTSTVVHDPTDPVPSIGGATMQPGDEISLIAGPHDRRSVQEHPGVIRWTSPPLDGAYEVTGPVTAVLWVDAEAQDADFYVALSRVTPDGAALHLTDGIRRCSLRDAPVKIEVPMGATSFEFSPGTRIRLEISASCFPRFEQHPDHDTAVRQRIFHDRSRPSHVVLPIIG
jgi:hypothetical protein